GVFAGVKKIAPADFLRAAAAVALAAIEAGSARPLFPETVAIPNRTPVATERFVAEDTPQLFGGWIIHPEGFRAPRIVEMARLQAHFTGTLTGRTLILSVKLGDGQALGPYTLTLGHPPRLMKCR